MDNNGFRNSALPEIIGGIVTFLVSSLLTYLVNRPKIIPILFIVLLLFLLLILHGHKRNKKDHNGTWSYGFTISSPIWRFILAASSLFILIGIILLLFFPKSGDSIQVFYWGTPTLGISAPNPPATEPESPNDTAIPPEDTLQPPTKIITLAPTDYKPPLDFKCGCISEAWAPWGAGAKTGQTLSPGSCWDFYQQGLLADKDGLRIYKNAQNSSESFGILSNLPQGDYKFQLSFIINKLVGIEEGVEDSTGDCKYADFFVGFVNSKSQDMQGKFFVFQNSFPKYYPFLFFRDHFPLDCTNPYDETLKNLGSEITIEVEREGLSMKNLQVSGVIQSGINYPEFLLPYGWDKLLIGYHLDEGASIDIKITNIEFIEK